MRSLPLADGSIDGLWSSYALLHIPPDDLGHTLQGFARVLKPGGTFCLLFAQGAQPSEDETHVELETFDYAPELDRTYIYVRPEYVVGPVRSAGLVIDDVGAEPGASRGAFWVRGRRAN
jgi:hypothetical protein